MAKHRASGDDAKINKAALGLIRRGKINEAGQLLKTTSTSNQTAIMNRIRKGTSGRQA